MNKKQWVFAVTLFNLSLGLPYLFLDAVLLTVTYLLVFGLVGLIFLVLYVFAWLGEH